MLEFERKVNAKPGRVLPAEAGLSGNFVLKFGGASVGKSGRSMGRTGARGRGPGELGRDPDPDGFRVLEGGARLVPRIRVAAVNVEGPPDEVGRLVGVEGRELTRDATFEFEFEGV